MMLILVVVFVGLFVASYCVRPPAPTSSQFERERQAAAGRADLVEREETRQAVATLLRLVRSIAAVGLVASAIAAMGWGWGVLVGLLCFLAVPAIAVAVPLRRFGAWGYARSEAWLVRAAEPFRPLSHLLQQMRPSDTAPPIQSKEELAALITASKVVSPAERQLLTAALGFGEQTVEAHMTPRSMIDSIGREALIGPLVLDDLHKTGHSRIPVVNGDIDHVVGILHTRDLMSLRGKTSPTAEQVMEKSVYYIREEQPLAHALAAFLRTRHHLFVVVNHYQETVGLISLEDVIEALLGRRIVDEFDAHDDLRAVAARNLHRNNHPDGRIDV